MTIQMTDEELRIERECVEQVFCLTGGELNDKPVTYTDDSGEGTLRYTYDGGPDYAQSDFEDLHSNYVRYFTAVRQYSPHHTSEIMGSEIKIDGKTYKCVSVFNSSGETQCPCADMGGEPDPFAGKECPYCGKQDGEKHGHIYLGDGWCEVVYRQSDEDDLRALATDHNMEIWKDDSVTLYCEKCTVITRTQTAMSANEGKCPDCGETVTDESPDIQKGKWWYWCCSPGCLPESEAMGPYDSELEALEAATEGLGD